jgi:hypothetical protein
VATPIGGNDGANVRSGRGINDEELRYLEPGASAHIVGHYENWFLMDYHGVEAWVYSGGLTSIDTDDVPEVQARASSGATPSERPAILRLGQLRYVA